MTQARIRINRRRPFTARITALVLAAPVLAVQDPARGPYPAGFRSEWAFDAGRDYVTEFDGGASYGGDGAPRPILVNMWYPASANASRTLMPYREYLALEEDERVAGFARALSAYARGVLIQELFDASEAGLDEVQRVALGRLLDAPTSCRRDADPASGPFPLVVYHSGAGSSYEDDALACEVLASHGYVVLGSAFPEADGSSLGIDGGRGSAEDMQFLVALASELDFVDRSRVGVLGHSAGAQAALRWAAQPGCPADVVVCLDTTQDYYALSIPTYRSFVDEVLAGVGEVEEPLLMVAGPGAAFTLADRLVRSPRTYVTFPELDHNEFISQGLQRLALGGADADPARARRVRLLHSQLLEYVVAYFDAALKDLPAPLARLSAAYEHTVPTDAPHVEFAPVGTSSPESYEPGSDHLPTPRQLVAILAERGAGALHEVLERNRARLGGSPILSSSMLTGSLLYDLDAGGRTEEARALQALFRSVDHDPLHLLCFLSDMSSLLERPAQARHYIEVALRIDPEHAGAKERASALAISAR